MRRLTCCPKNDPGADVALEESTKTDQADGNGKPAEGAAKDPDEDTKEPPKYHPKAHVLRSVRPMSRRSGESMPKQGKQANS